MDDEGRPFDIGIQVLVSNHFKRLFVKSDGREH